MPLTNTEIQKAKPSAVPVKLADGRGLYLLIPPSLAALNRSQTHVN